MGDSRPPVLSDDLLRRFHERAPVVRPREPLLRRRLRGASQVRLPEDGGAARVRRPRPVVHGVHAGDAPAGLLGAGDGSRHEHAHLLVRRRGRRSTSRGTSPATGCSRRPGKGEVFAAGHAEAGNDLPVLLSTTKAERVDGGYRFTGRKSFGSLAPVWTQLGLHGMDASDPKAPKIVHGFLSRDAKGYRIEPTWDVLGMRATKSDDTILEGAFVPDSRMPRGSRRRRRRRSLRPGDFRLGARRLRQRLLRPRAPGVRPHRRVAQEAAVDRRRRGPWPTTPPCSGAWRRWSMELEAIEPLIERLPTTGRTAWITAGTGRPRS